MIYAIESNSLKMIWFMHLDKDAPSQKTRRQNPYEATMVKSINRKIEKHLRYWQREDTGRPLASVTVAEDFFVSRHYGAARPLLQPGKVITPDMLDVTAFMADYEKMYEDSLLVEQDGFWVGMPFTGIPWMEAMLGCKIVAMDNSFVSKPTGATIDSQEDIILDQHDPWLAKYLEFTEALIELSNDRFPVGEPILRGPSDMLGAILGQEAMVYAILLKPEKSARLLRQLTEAFLQVIKKQQALLKDFHGGRSIGFYNVWTPGKCIWYQEDLSALLSPDLFRKMLRPCGELICRDYDYTAIHIHPSSFFIVDELLKMDRLKVIQVNKDVGGPSVSEMMELFQKIVKTKNLIIWGDLNEEDLTLIQDQLPSKGVYLHIVAKDIAHANHLLQTISPSA